MRRDVRRTERLVADAIERASATGDGYRATDNPQLVKLRVQADAHAAAFGAVRDALKGDFALLSIYAYGPSAPISTRV